jgi:hypothetical protein
MMPQSHEDGRISNLYNYKIINKTNREMILSLDSEVGETKLVGKSEITLPPQGVAEGALFIFLNPDQMTGLSQPMTLVIFNEGDLVKKVKTKFIGR